MSFLQKQNITHGDIRPELIFVHKKKGDQRLNFKLLDRVSDLGSAINTQLNNIIIANSLYLSPRLYEALSKGTAQSMSNLSFKNDVFSMGLVALELGIMSSIQPIYEKDKSQFSHYTLVQLLKKFDEKYNPNNLLGELVHMMLEVDENMRPDFIQLQSRLPPIQDLEPMFGGFDINLGSQISRSQRTPSGGLVNDHNRMTSPKSELRKMDHLAPPSTGQSRNNAVLIPGANGGPQLGIAGQPSLKGSTSNPALLNHMAAYMANIQGKATPPQPEHPNLSKAGVNPFLPNFEGQNNLSIKSGQMNMYLRDQTFTSPHNTTMMNSMEVDNFGAKMLRPDQNNSKLDSIYPPGGFGPNNFFGQSPSEALHYNVINKAAPTSSSLQPRQRNPDIPQQGVSNSMPGDTYDVNSGSNKFSMASPKGMPKNEISPKKMKDQILDLINNSAKESNIDSQPPMDYYFTPTPQPAPPTQFQPQQSAQQIQQRPQPQSPQWTPQNNPLLGTSPFSRGPQQQQPPQPQPHQAFSLYLPQQPPRMNNQANMIANSHNPFLPRSLNQPTRGDATRFHLEQTYY